MRSNSQHLFIDFENMKLGNNVSYSTQMNTLPYPEAANSHFDKSLKNNNNEYRNSEIFSANSDSFSFSEYHRKNSSLSKIDFDCLSKKGKSIISTNNQYLPINLDTLELKSIGQSEYHQIINSSNRRKTLNILGQNPSKHLWHDQQYPPIKSFLNDSLNNSMKNDQNSTCSQSNWGSDHKSSFYEFSQQTNERFERRFSDISKMNYSSSKFINCKEIF